MSISATSGSGSGWGMMSTQRRQPPELTKDQLTQLDQKLKSEGKDTSNLDKIVSNFDQLDTNSDGKVSMDELKTGASQYGINAPQGPPRGGHHHHAKKADNDGDDNGSQVSANSWGPPPGLLTIDGTSSDSDSSSSVGSSSSFDPNSFMLSLLEKFAGSDPTSGAQGSEAATSSVNIAA